MAQPARSSFRILSTVCALACATTLLGATALPAHADITHPNVVSANPDNNTPHVLDGEVLALAQVGNRIVVGGTFTTIRTAAQAPQINRPYLFAFDPATGQIDLAFSPVLDRPVRTLADGGGGTVLVGGDFTTVGGANNRYLTKLTVNNGAVVGGFAPNVNGIVEDVVVRSGLAFIGGVFDRVGDATRLHLAAVRVDTGALAAGLAVPVGGATGDKVKALDVSPDGKTLMLAGAFMRVGNFERVQLAMIDLSVTPARVASWKHDSFEFVRSPGFSCVKDVDFSPNGRFFVIAAQCPGSPIGDAVTRFETAGRGPVEPTWVNWAGYDTLWSVAATGAAVYAGGHQRSMNSVPGGLSDSNGTVPRQGIAAVDPSNGVALSWNPGRTRGQGVFVMLPTTDRLFVGSDTEQLGGEWHARLGSFPLAGGAAVPQSPAATLPATLYTAARTRNALARQTLGADAVGRAAAFASPISWSTMQTGFATDDAFFSVAADGTLLRNTFNGTTVGTARNLNTTTGLNRPGWVPLNGATGLAWDGQWLYYTRAGDANLYRRGFSLDSLLLGSVATPVSGPEIDGISWTTARGLAIAGRYIFSGQADGRLVRREFSGGSGSGAPTPRSAATVSGPAVDGRNWSTTTALLVRSR